MDGQTVLIDPLEDLETLQSTSGSTKGESSSTSSNHLVDLVDVPRKRRFSLLRRTNFRQDERDVLVSLVSEYILFDARGGANGAITRWRSNGTNRARAWQDIAQRFNSHPTFCKRDAVQLRKCWMNMKSRSQFSAAQRRMLGLDCPIANRSRRGKRASAGVRLRSPSVGLQAPYRFNSARKTCLSRVNRASSIVTQAKINRSKQRAKQTDAFRQDQAHTDFQFPKPYSAPSQGVFQMMDGGGSRGEPDAQRGGAGSRDVQYVPNSVGTGHQMYMPTSHSHVHPIGIQQASPTLSQPENSQRLSEVTNVYLMPGDTMNAGHLGSFGGELSLPRVEAIPPAPPRLSPGGINESQPRMIRNPGGRPRPSQRQPVPAALSPEERYRRTNPQTSTASVTIGEFLGRSIEMRTDATQTSTTTAAPPDALSLSPPLRLQQFLSEDSSGGSVAPSTNEQRVSPHVTGIMGNVIGQESLFALQSTDAYSIPAGVGTSGHGPGARGPSSAGPIIANVQSIAASRSDSSIRSSKHDSVFTSGDDEIQIIIKTEDDMEDDNTKEIICMETEQTETSTERGVGERESWKKTDRFTSSPHRSLPVKPSLATADRKSPEKHSARPVASSKTHRQSHEKQNQTQQPITAVQRKSSSSSERSEVRCDASVSQTMSRIAAKRESAVHYIGSDEDAAAGDSGLIRISENQQEKDHDVATVNDGGGNTSDHAETEPNVEQPKRRVREGGAAHARHRAVDEEMTARDDLLTYRVRKAKEEARMAKCHRKLLEVEVSSARQHMKLSKLRGEAEIELLRAKVRQENAKADLLISQRPERGEVSGDP